MNQLNLILYNIFIALYTTAIRTAALWNNKAKLWIIGRKAFPSMNFDHKTIWMHCASLGEFEQGRPLLEAIKKEYPTYPIVLSFFSPSGYEIKKNYPGADKIIYLPIDTAHNANRLIKEINPAIAIWVKYEYWYHFLTTLKQHQIPVLLVSGIFRNSQPFFKRHGTLHKKMLSSFTHFFVQNEESKELLNTINNNNSSVSGDTRFDRVIEIAEKNEPVLYIKEFINNHRVLIAGSTWDDDEKLLIHYASIHPEIKIIIAPHEIDLINLNTLKKEFKHALFYSELAKEQNSANEASVLIIDNIGMLATLYQYADITYVGGGFNSSGIHNTLEAAAQGKPVIFGPVYEKFAEAVGLIKTGGAFTINNVLQLEELLDRLFNNKEVLAKASEASKEYVLQSGGATNKIITYIKENRLLTN